MLVQKPPKGQTFGGFCVSGLRAVKRTYVYVDGFNLYYRALKGTPHKWLDILALVQGLLDSDNHILKIRYFTARVSGKVDPGQPVRQETYIRALETLTCVEVHYGNFLTKQKIRPLVHPLADGTTHVKVWNTEEKGSDVNLATHLVHDAWRGAYDVAVVLSQDTDLCEPLRIVRDELAKPVGLIWLDGTQPGKLGNMVSFVRHVTAARLAAAQFPPTVRGRKGRAIVCPSEWTSVTARSVGP